MSDRFGRLLGARAALGVKMPVRAATTANITLSGFQTIDDVAFNQSAVDADLNMRILVKNQTDQTRNGIYEVQSGTWERTKDFDGNTDYVKGSLVYVTDGTINGGFFFTVSSADPQSIGVNNLTFVANDFGSGDTTGAASSTAGNVAGFADTTGKVLSDLGSFIALLAGANWTNTTIASNTTTDIGAQTTPVVTVSLDVSPVTSLGSSINRLKLVLFTGIIVLTHNATTLRLPGSANITTADGDWAIFRSGTDGRWRCVHYQRVAGRNLNTGVTDTLAVGYTATSYANGTVSSGTLTPNPANGNFQHYTNNGAHTLAPPSSVCTIVLEMTNAAAAGALTTSSFTFVSGDALTTTDGNKFLLYITKSQSYSLLQRKALQ